MYEGGEQRPESGHDPNLVGLLSLQLLLLAFFILLVSMSSFDVQRVRSVLDSVQTAFSEISNAPGGEDQVQRADAVTLTEIVDEIEGVLVSALQLDRVARIGEGAIAFDIPADSLFAANSAQLLPGRDEILRRLVAALDRRPAGVLYDIELLVGRTIAASAEPPALPNLAIDRAGMLSRSLHESGALESGLAAGLLPESPDKLRIVIALTDRPRATGLFAVGVHPGAAAPVSPESGAPGNEAPGVGEGSGQ